ncbi:MAG: GspH/FimT family pseudopilin [Desulfobacterales bacterium]|nr:GspH/FimT family pseudopilin [Desulfobacterales bacterium]
MLRKNSGFTALELATTIAIVAVIAALVMPPYLRWNRAHRLEGAATNLTADLEMAKVRAIRENAFVVVEFNTDSYTIFVDNGEGGGTAADWNRNGSEIIAQDRDLPTGVQIDTGSLSFPSFNSKTRFNGRGIPPDILGPEIVSIANTINSRLITINRLGFINVQ